MLERLVYLVLLLSIICCDNKDSSSDAYKVVFAVQSIDDELADSLIVFFKNDYLKDDLQYLSKDTTFFQFYKINLNRDPQDEIFVRFMGPYFCGSGGCNFTILDSNFKELNNFTTTTAPIIATEEYRNNWRVLVTTVDGEQKQLINKNNRYPSNPSMAPTSQLVVKEGDHRLFDDETNPSKTYFFK